MYAGTLLCNQTPCTCIPGCPFTIYLEFLSPKYLENMKPNILATYAGVTIPYPLTQDDACDGIENTQCPIVKNEHIKYKISMDILNIFPEVTVALEFTIKDQDTGDAVICVLFDIDVRKIDCPS
ncbi:NPC intracellular cholesterol transporter 2-like [Sitophilus oryzae]|uniref:NPC intracellular cholesterol transporter 2-like n=1 Tax=Sitophilus oryzae TaxID=7048 RepID=A0A6J2Y394_SITOR|nr:NPC intracellular cholesterol transporter 2-like [Sitophilus oryzae]